MTAIGVLALQGDFVEHESSLRQLGASVRQVRTPEELRGLNGLIIPGGESTTLCRLMLDFNLYDPLRAVIKSGLPVWGTCAGLIVLARRAIDLDFPTLDALDVTVRRNAHGRQVDSFEADLDVSGLTDANNSHAHGEAFRGVFIRAPVVEEVGEPVDVLARLPRDAERAPDSPVALRQSSLLATAFHPELTNDQRFHRYFLEIVGESGAQSSPK